MPTAAANPEFLEVRQNGFSRRVAKILCLGLVILGALFTFELYSAHRGRFSRGKTIANKLRVGVKSFLSSMGFDLFEEVFAGGLL